MPENITINVTPQPTASVDVRADNVASYYYELAKQWAISPDLVEFLDYSSKHYAFVSKGYKEEVDALVSDSGFIAVKNDLVNIDTVADSIANVNTTAGNITNINTVADISSNVTTVAGISSDITAVNNNATNINACVSNASNINTVAGSIANVNTVAGDKTNIDTVAGISGNITTVAGISTDVTGVASISSAVSAVNTNSTNINTCATNISNINTCAANIPTLGAKVDKAGDTMTGDLYIQKSTYTKYSSSYNEAGRLFVKDKNDNNVGTFTIFSNNSHNYVEMTLYDGNSSSAWFGIRKTSASNSDEVQASSGVKQSITNWAFPSANYDDLSLGATGASYTAPANGYVYISATQSSTNAFVFLMNNANGMQVVGQPPNVSNFEIRCVLPVAKGNTYRIDYGTVTFNVFRFVYAIGG